MSESSTVQEGTSESRQSVRYHCEHHMWLRSSYTTEEYQLAEVHNISSGGAYFLANETLELDELLDISLEVPSQCRLLELRGPVRHVHQSGQQHYYGLQFEECQGIDKGTFHSYLQDIFCQPVEDLTPECGSSK